MKEMNELLQAMIADGLNLKDFYVVSLWEDHIEMQAHYNPNLMKQFVAKDYVSTVNKETGFINVNKENINITITN